MVRDWSRRDLSLHLDVNGTLITNYQITMDQIITKVQIRNS